MQDKTIDNGKFFDWGRVSQDYARYRDIYPPVFYERIAERNLCVKGQKALDLGTGTGVLPRNMYQYGAEWTAADISPNQIHQAIKVSEDSNLNINYIVCSTEELDFPNDSFDVVTACQCFWYFNHDITASKIYNMLKKINLTEKLSKLYISHSMTIIIAIGISFVSWNHFLIN